MSETRANQFAQRMQPYYDELKWLYTELYGQTEHFQQLCDMAYQFFCDRKPALHALDEQRLTEPDWYRQPDMIGMMMYADRFNGGLLGVQEKLDYLKSLHVRYLHFMPLLKMPKEQNDGGYAVTDFRQVDERIGTMEQLEQLADCCRENHMSICLDFIVNHTSDEHEWAVRARNGEKEYQDRYMCYDTYDIPAEYEKTTPQVFPDTAPGNFIFDKQMNKWVLSSFYPFQWDMNYKNPAVFNEMAGNLLYLANVGVEIFRIDAVPYIWKQLGTSSRNLPQVHTIMRMMRILCKIVCPAVVFKGEVVMAPKEVAPYFGPVEKPECDILYNVTNMVCIWNSLATRDTRLLRHQMDEMDALPREYTFVNYVRCHDDIGWGLDEEKVQQLGFDPLEHKKFLYHFYIGDFPGSFARGEWYNYDPATQDARSCGTCASLCGIEKAGFEQNPVDMETALNRHLLVHTYILSLGGIPVLYSGDEIGQVNDYTYHDRPEERDDSRFIHRGHFQWENIAKITDRNTVQGRIFQSLQNRIEIRQKHSVFHAGAKEQTLDTGDHALLAFRRENEQEELIAVYNFCEQEKTLWIPLDGKYIDLICGEEAEGTGLQIEPYGCRWFIKVK